MAINPNTAIIRKRVWEAYEEQRPKPGEQYAAFCEALAEELDILPEVVKRIVTKESLALDAQIRRSTLTNAQNIANLIGADMALASEQTREMLTAVKRKPLLDKSGKPCFDPETKELIYLEEPDWQARGAAIRIMCSIHGAYAPQQYEVKGQHTVTHDMMDRDALEARWKELESSLHEFGLMQQVIEKPKRRRTIDVQPTNGNLLSAADAGASPS